MRSKIYGTVESPSVRLSVSPIDSISGGPAGLLLSAVRAGDIDRQLQEHAGLRRRRARVQIAAATLSGNSRRQTVHTHRASVRQAAKLVAALLRVARVTAGLAESNGSLPPGL